MDKRKIEKIESILETVSNIVEKPILNETDKQIISKHVKEAIREAKNFKLFKRLN